MRPLAYLVVCGAPPAGSIGELIALVQGDGWDVCTIPTDAALEWLDVPAIEQLTGFEVPRETRKPAEPKRSPKPALLDLVAEVQEARP
jgi:hypothetical protein